MVTIKHDGVSKTDATVTDVKVLHPNVYWAQTNTLITLKIDLKDAKFCQTRFTENQNLQFQCIGTGACGSKKAYTFALHFFSAIDNENALLHVTDNRVDLGIPKQENGWWPRLVATPQKPHWLKIDFDRWLTEEDLMEAAEREARDVHADYPAEYRRLQRNELGYVQEHLKKAYMLIYNLFQLTGFLYILIVLGIVYYRDGNASVAKAYEHVGSALKFCQLLQFLEVLHPLFDYVKGSTVAAAMQVFGRNFVLFVMIEMEQRMQSKPVVFYLIVIWSLVEVFRYPYYICQLRGWTHGLITWLRYTVWIPLYPLGLFCEGVVILRNIPYFEETQRFSVQMPNRLNFTFDMVLFLKAYLAFALIPGGCYLISQMANTRTKKLKSN